MRGGAAGWRTARWRGEGDAAAVPPAAPATARRGVQGPAAPVAPPTGFERIEQRFTWPWQGVDWSLGYVAFLGYIFIITSYLVNLGQVLMLAAIVGVTLGSRERWKFPPMIAWMVLFLMLLGLTYQSTEYRQYDTKALQDITKVMIIAAVTVSVLTNRARIRFFMFFYLASFALYPVRGGIMNWFVYNATTQGRVAWNYAFENPNDYAALLLFPLGLCLALLYTERGKLIRQAAFIGLASIPMIIFMTQSRGAILAIGVAVLAYFVLQGKGRTRSFIGVVAIAAVVITFAPSDVWTRLGSLKSAGESGDLRSANDQRSAEQRFEIWKVAWAVHKQFPWTGVGWSAYPNAHAEVARRGMFNPIAGGARDAHNTYLTVLAETGWIGLLLWSLIIGSAITTAIRSMRRVRPYAEAYAMQLKALMLALLAYAAAGVFGSFAGMSFTYVNLSTLLALALVTREEVAAFERGPRVMRSALRLT